MGSSRIGTFAGYASANTGASSRLRGRLELPYVLDLALECSADSEPGAHPRVLDLLPADAVYVVRLNAEGAAQPSLRLPDFLQFRAEGVLFHCPSFDSIILIVTRITIVTL